jgi:hypothetical protein
LAATAPTVSEFLLDVSEDAALRRAFHEDPHGTLKKFDIATADCEAILAADIDRVRDAVERELAKDDPIPVPRNMTITTPCDN